MHAGALTHVVDLGVDTYGLGLVVNTDVGGWKALPQPSHDGVGWIVQGFQAEAEAYLAVSQRIGNGNDADRTGRCCKLTIIHTLALVA